MTIRPHESICSRAVFPLIASVLWSASAQAIDFLALRCKAAGDGWFEYQMNLLVEPLFETVVIGDLSLSPHTNIVDYAPPPERWLVSTNADGSPSSTWNFEWNHQESGVMPRPYSALFRFRSGHTNWLVQPLGALVTMTLWPDLDLPFWSGQGWLLPYVVGYARFPALVPCAVSDADGSGPEYLSRLELVKDPEIKGLVREKGEVAGLDFQIDYASAVQVLASDNLTAWFPVGELFANPGEQRWLSPSATGLPGNYFKLAVLRQLRTAEAPWTSWPPKSGPGLDPGKSPPLHLAGSGDRLIVWANTTPGGSFRLLAGSNFASLREVKRFPAHAARSRIELPWELLPTVGVVAVIEE